MVADQNEILGPCSWTCGNGTQTINQSCKNPPPSNGGLNCIGNLTSQQLCTNEPCPISNSQFSYFFMSNLDGNWTMWSNWASCSVTCGNGTISRTRFCTNPSPANGGSNCNGTATEQKFCSLALCKISKFFFTSYDTAPIYTTHKINAQYI